MASWPMLPYTSSSRQLSSLVKVGSAFFLVQACLPCGASPLGPVGLARAKKFQVGTMDVDRAASLEILTSTKLILPFHGRVPYLVVQLPSSLGLQ
ncbi:hypothetical protein MRX96_021822 [Rhipicephalus microplus]